MLIFFYLYDNSGFTRNSGLPFNKNNTGDKENDVSNNNKKQ